MAVQSVSAGRGLANAPVDRIEIEGFKSIRRISIDLRALNLLIGPNGAGKSNFISVFSILNEISKKNLQLFVAKEGGANSLLHLGQKVTSEIAIRVEVDDAFYSLVLVPTANDSLVFGEEKYGAGGEGPTPWIK